MCIFINVNSNENKNIMKTKKTRYILKKDNQPVGEFTTLEEIAQVANCTLRHLYRFGNPLETGFKHKKVHYTIIDKLDLM